MKMARQEGSQGGKTVLNWKQFLLGFCLMLLGPFTLVATGSYWTDKGLTDKDLSLVLALLMFGGAVVAARSFSEREPEGPDSASPRGASLKNILDRSSDALATLQDLARHGDDTFGNLSELLRRAGILEWEHLPKLAVKRLSTNDRWFLSPKEGELDEDDYDRLVAVEAALNVYEDLNAPQAAALPIDIDLWTQVRIELSSVMGRTPSQKTAQAREWLLEGATPGGEWECRVRISSFAERVPAPFRVMAKAQANVAKRLVCTDVELPRPASMGMAAPDANGRAQAARAYALRSMLLVARGTLDASDAVARVVVNGHEHGSGETILSLDVMRGDLDRLLALARPEGAFDVGMPKDRCLRSRLRLDGWLDEVEPFLRRTDEDVSPRSRERAVELDDSPATDAVRKACGATLVRDLSIDEDAGRTHAWGELADELGCTTSEAVSKLMALRRTTLDATVAEACDRTSAALVEGTLDITDREGLGHLFVSGNSLSSCVGQAKHVLAKDPLPEDAGHVLAELESELAAIAQSGAYLDDGATVHRYFNSTAERVHYNLHADDGGREVRLVSLEYYVAHEMATIALLKLQRADEALVHAEEMVRVAPLGTGAALHMVRCLEAQSRIFEARDILVHAIEHAATSHEMATCYYRLAFMERKLDRSDVAAACYLQAIRLGSTDITIMAICELKDLIDRKEVTGLPFAGVAQKILEKAKIPADEAQGLRSSTLAAAMACTDAGIFTAGRKLTAVLLELDHDDVLAGVFSSLA